MIISRCLVTVRRLLSVAALGALLTWPSVGRVATTVMFDMPAQPLSQALAAFSQRAFAVCFKKEGGVTEAGTNHPLVAINDLLRIAAFNV